VIAALRGIGRTVAVLCFLVSWGIGSALLWPLAAASGRQEGWRKSVLRGGCRGVLWLLNVRVTVDGAPPAGTGILVTNHLSYVDILVLGSFLEVVFVSRDDVRNWPVIGPFARVTGTVFIDRDRKSALPAVVESMHAWNAQGVSIVFFPEGTSGRGDVVMPFRSSLFESAVRAEAVVHAAALHYATASGDDAPETAVCWWGDTDFLPHAWRLVRLRRVDARVTFSDAEIVPVDRKQAAREAHAAVERVFRPSSNGDDATSGPEPARGPEENAVQAD